MAERTAVFYISGHGFGHASRSIEVINALIDRREDLRVIIRSSVAAWLVERSARQGVQLSPAEVDTGVVQIDSLHLDATESISRAERFMSSFGVRVADETRFLREADAALVVADLPPLGIAAASAAQLPAIALGNFTWDWIYEHYAGGGPLARTIGDVYANTTLALRLPMWGGFSTMQVIRDLPFVARRSQRDPADVRATLGLPAGRRIVLISFGGYGLGALDRQALGALPDYCVLGPEDVEGLKLDEHGLRYEDLVKAVDVVISKPGYGIVSECVANDTALLYTSRGDFREYPLLVQAMPQYLPCAFISHDDLFAGRWQSPLDALLAQPVPARVETNGADVAADMLLDYLT